MNAASLNRLLLLSAIWGGSFLFMRMGAPVLGPIVLMAFRVGLAALFLLGVALLLKKDLQVREHWKHYFVLGLFNSTVPFLLFGVAAQTLSASLLSIINATAPIWGAIIGAVWIRHALTQKSVVGLCLGVIGVGLLVGFDQVTMLPGAGWAIGAALGASFSYGIASIYAKSAKAVEPFANAHGSMWASTLMIVPAIPFFPIHESPTTSVMFAVLLLGVVCSGVAYLLYFRLIADIGATSALTVTFLVPVFGVLWGVIFLDEIVGWHTLIGSIVVISGTALVTGFSPSVIWSAKNRAAIKNQ